MGCGLPRSWWMCEGGGSCKPPPRVDGVSQVRKAPDSSDKPIFSGDSGGVGGFPFHNAEFQNTRPFQHFFDGIRQMNFRLMPGVLSK